MMSEQETSLAHLIQHLPAVLYRRGVEKHGRFHFLSENIQMLVSITSSEIAENPHLFWKLLHLADRQRVEDALQRAWAQQVPYSLEYRLILPNGNIIWVLDAGSPLQETKSFNGFFTDITARKASEYARIEKEAQYKSMVAALSEGVVVHAMSGEIIASNPASWRILGLTEDQMHGRTSLDPNWRTVREDGTTFPGTVHPAMVTLMSGMPQYAVIMGLHKPNGTQAWISVNSQPIYTESGEMIGAVATFVDVTQMRMANERIKNSEVRFRTVFEAIKYALLIVDENGQIVMTNPAVKECFGYEEEELLGRNINKLVPNNIRPNHQGMMRDFFNRDETRLYAMGSNREVNGLKKDGTTFPVEVTLSPIMMNGKRFVFCSARDISTDQRRLQLERAHEEIERAHKKITDSVRYAQRIQMAQLGNHQHILKEFNAGTIFFMPKDIVSGDFYWFTNIQHLDVDEAQRTASRKNFKIIVAADCTGHGVPGALMAALGSAFLHEIINEHHIIEPHHILSVLNKKIIATLSRGENVADGMDMSIMAFEEEKELLHFAGAKHPMYQIRNGQLDVFQGARVGLGGHEDLAPKFFKHTISYQKGDRYYIGSDGFQDQFGGPDNKRYLRSRFKELLLKMQDVPMNEQNSHFLAEHQRWRQKESQTDDILVIGIEI